MTSAGATNGTLDGMGWKSIVIVVLVAVLLILGILVMFPASSASPQPALGSGAPSGLIVISSVTDPSLPFLDTYMLDVTTHQLVMADPDSTSQENMYTFSSNGSSVAFLGTTQALAQSVISSGGKGDPMQVYRAVDQATGTLPSVSQAQALTNDVIDQKGVPVMSDDGRSVLYMEIPVNEIATSTPSIAGYTIHLLSDAPNTLSVQGTYPQWYGQDSFYYIASDGVRLYDITKAASTLVLPITAQSDFKIAVSHDGSMLAFSDPDSNTVFVYSISAGGLQLTPLNSINVSGFWAAFSPDDAFMAVQTVDGNGVPEILIFGTKDFTQVGEPISLSALLNTRLFVTAWVR